MPWTSTSPWSTVGFSVARIESSLTDHPSASRVERVNPKRPKSISNVPGSRVPVYLCGAKMTDYYPLSIVVHGIALNITVQSHVDHLCFGLIACRRAVPDVQELGNHLQRAMATLRSLVAPALAAATGEAPAPAVEARSPPAASADAKRRSTRAKAKPARPPRLRAVASAARAPTAVASDSSDKAPKAAKPHKARPLAAAR